MASKALKVILIGCAGVIFLGIIAVGVGGYFLKKWGSDKLKTIENLAGTEESDYGKKTTALREKYPFTPPANNVIQENQLQRFLAIRKEMHSVYQKYEAEFKKLSGDQSFTGTMKGLKMWEELKQAHAGALDSQRMSPDEYTYLVTTIYSTWVAKGAKDVLKDQSVQENTGKQLKESIANLDQQIQDPNTPQEAKNSLQQTRDQLQAQLDSLPQNEQITQLDQQLDSIPPENIELFKKYQPEIEKYSMSGLEFIGL